MTMRSTQWLATAVAFAVAAAFLAPAFQAAAEDLVELKIELPKPMFVGTPKNIKSDRLDPNTGKKRPPFKVPAGVELISAEKAITASDDEPIIGELEMLTDGDKEGADGSFVEFGPDLQWVQVGRWVLNLLITGEEVGWTKAMASKGPLEPRLTVPDAVHQKLGLAPGWPLAVIKAVGNYGEIFERNVGAESRLDLPRSVNALWSRGGILYAPPMR